MARFVQLKLGGSAKFSEVVPRLARQGGLLRPGEGRLE